MRTGISSISFPDLALHQFLEYAQKMKVAAAAVDSRHVEKQEESDLENIGKLFSSSGLEEIAVLWKGGDDVVPDRIDTYLGLCQRLGAHILVVEAPGSRSAEEITALFTEPVKKAGDLGLRLALDSSLPLGIDGVGEIVENIDSDTFGLSFDLGNWMRLGEDPVTFASYLGKYVHLAIVKDLRPSVGTAADAAADRSGLACVPVGKGEIALPEVMKEMSLMGFDGTYCVEIDALHPDYRDVKSAVRDSIKYVKKLKRKLN